MKDPRLFIMFACVRDSCDFLQNLFFYFYLTECVCAAPEFDHSCRIFAPHATTSGAFLERNKSFPLNFLVYTSGREWCMSGEYERAFQESVSDPERFWGAAAEKVH